MYNKFFPKIDVPNFNLRLSEEEKVFYDEMNLNWKNYRLKFQAIYNILVKIDPNFTLTFNYGLFYQNLPSKYHSSIVYHINILWNNIYLTYEGKIIYCNKEVDFLSNLEVEENDEQLSFVEEMYEYLEHFETQPLKYDFINTFIKYPCIIPYNIYRKLDFDKIGFIFEDLDDYDQVNIRNIMENYILLLFPHELKMEVSVPIYENILSNYIPDLSYIVGDNITIEDLKIGMKNDILYINYRSEYFNFFIYIGDKGIKVFVSDDDEYKKKFLEKVAEKMNLYV